MGVKEQNQEIQDILVKHFVSGTQAQKELANRVAGVMLDHIPRTIAWRYRLLPTFEGNTPWQFTDCNKQIQILADSNYYEIEELFV